MWKKNTTVPDTLRCNFFFPWPPPDKASLGIRVWADLVDFGNLHGLGRGRLAIVAQTVGVGNAEAGGQAPLQLHFLLRPLLLLRNGAIQPHSLLPRRRRRRARSGRCLVLFAAGRGRGAAVWPLALLLTLLSLAGCVQEGGRAGGTMVLVMDGALLGGLHRLAVRSRPRPGQEQFVRIKTWVTVRFERKIWKAWYLSIAIR